MRSRFETTVSTRGTVFPAVPARWQEASAALGESGGRIEAVTDEEILGMRSPGNSPEELPPLPLDAAGNPVIHRPSKPDSGGDAPLETPGNPALDAPPVEIPGTRP